MSTYETSDKLADRVADVIGEWLADNGGGMLSMFNLTVNYLDDEGVGTWATAHADRQTPVATLGLLRWHTLYVETELIDYFREDRA